MRKENSIQNVVIIVLAATILVMSVGYATYTKQLNIEGTATFEKAVWNVEFDENSFSETSIISATDYDISNDSVTYEVTLPSPGSEYSFTIDAKNTGTIDAKMSKITLSGITAEQSKYISYKVNYNGTEYTNTTDGLAIALAAGNSHTMVVTLKYILPANATDLPSANVTVNPTVSLDYEDNAA